MKASPLIGTDNDVLRIVYGIEIDPKKGYVFVCNAIQMVAFKYSQKMVGLSKVVVGMVQGTDSLFLRLVLLWTWQVTFL